MFYDKHIFVCVHARANNARCCAQSGALTLVEFLKKNLAPHRTNQPASIRVNRAGCLGRCELGPLLVIYPEGIWYRYRTEEDLKKIIQEHIINKKIVRDLWLNQ